MIFSVSDDGNEWSLHFGPDSITLTVLDLTKEMTIRSQKIPLTAWSLLLSPRQEYSNKRLAGVPLTPNQAGKMEMGNEIHSSVGVQDGHKRVSGVRSGEYRVLLGISWLKHGCNFPTTHKYSLFPVNFQQLWDEFNVWKPHSNWQRIKQGELSSSSNYSSLQVTKLNPASTESHPSGTRIENVPDYVPNN